MNINVHSAFEIVNTSVEFEDDTRTIKCSCCREGNYDTIAVHALITTEGVLVCPFHPLAVSYDGGKKKSMCNVINMQSNVCSSIKTTI